MSRLGKSFKNRFLRQALALVLAGSMVMSGMPDSLAAESSDGKTSIAEVQEETENASEEAAEEQDPHPAVKSCVLRIWMQQMAGIIAQRLCNKGIS